MQLGTKILNIPKWSSETDNTIAKWKIKAMIYKTLHRKLKLEQHEPYHGDDLGCSEKVVSSPCSTIRTS
jgi:hypothetical protein